MTTTLFDSLQRDFCPTLDSSLIAALLVEIESDSYGNAVTPTLDQIASLRTTLNELTLQADEAQQSEFSDVQFTSQLDETISSWTTHEGGGPSRSSGSSESSDHPFNTPLGYLQATFPDIPTSRLKKTLLDAQKDDKDMWYIVENLLSEELIREKVERGLDALHDEEDYNFDESAVEWEMVERKPVINTPTKKKSQPRPKKIVVSDVRQHHHIQNLPRKQTGLRPSPSSVGQPTDPWMQVTSLSSHLSTLLPPHPASAFASFFHSPKHATSYDALRACLSALCKSTEEGHTLVLFNILDIILPDYDDDDAELLSRVISDAQLAVAVTDGDGDVALDIFAVLRDLDSDAALGLTHLPVPQPSSSSSLSSLKQNGTSAWKGPVQPPDVRPPPAKVKLKPPPASAPNKPSPYEWQSIPQRMKVGRGPHPLEHHIPAYARNVNGMKTNRHSHSRSESWSGETGFRQRMSAAMAKRDQALRNATRMWQKGNAKNRGGDIALYYAERARELEQVARQEMLGVAREMVHSKRTTHGNQDTIDLHGTTVAEAIIIVKEILNDRASTISQAKPIKIITGRGAHSAGQVSVLKPAVRKALEGDGWVVGSWDGGLVVRSRRT